MKKCAPASILTVRIPVFTFDRMMVLDEDKNPISGYAFEYLQTIAAYAGWGGRTSERAETVCRVTASAAMRSAPVSGKGVNMDDLVTKWF